MKIKLKVIFLLCIIFNINAMGGDFLIKNSSGSGYYSEADARAIFEMLNFENRYRIFQSPEKVRELLTDTFRQVLLAEEAKRLGLDVEPKNAARLERIRQSKLIQMLQEYKKQELEKQLPDFSRYAQEIYQGFPDKFTSSEQVDVGHILLRFKNCDERESQYKKMQGIQERLSKGESFEDLARTLSEDKGSADKEGRLGIKKRGTFILAFEEAAFALRNPGQISNIIETNAGLHLIKLYEYKPASQKSFEIVKTEIISRLEDAYIKRELSYWRQSIWDANPIRFNEQALNSFIQNFRNSLPKIEQ